MTRWSDLNSNLKTNGTRLVGVSNFLKWLGLEILGTDCVTLWTELRMKWELIWIWGYTVSDWEEMDQGLKPYVLETGLDSGTQTLRFNTDPTDTILDSGSSLQPCLVQVCFCQWIWCVKRNFPVLTRFWRLWTPDSERNPQEWSIMNMKQMYPFIDI